MPYVCKNSNPAQIETENTFKWVGRGEAIHRRRPNDLHYQSFMNGELRITIGDFVLIRNDDSMDPEDHMNCFVGEVKDLFENDDSKGPQAKIQWYSHIFELPPRFTKNLQNVDYYKEVVEDYRSEFSDFINAESIFKRCSIIFLKEDSLNGQMLKDNEKCPAFFCRYKFTGSSIVPKFRKVKPKESKSVSSTNHKLMNSAEKKVKRHTAKSVSSPMCDVNSKSFEDFDLKPVKISLKRLDYILSDDDLHSDSINLQSLAERLKQMDFFDNNRRSPRKNGLLYNFETQLAKTFSKSLTLPKLDNGKNLYSSKSETSDTELKPVKLQNRSSNKKKKLSGLDDLELEGTPRKTLALTPTNSKNQRRNNAINPLKCLSEMKMKSVRRNAKRSSCKVGGSEKCKTTPKLKASKPNAEVNVSPLIKNRTSRRSLKFESNSVDEKNETVATTRYGRKVKSVSNLLASDVESLLSTPRKILTPKKRTVAQKNTKFYHSDESDDESVYAPSYASSANEDEIFSDFGEDTNSEKKKSSSKKSSVRAPKLSSNILKTPSSRKKKTSLCVTPTIPERQQPVKTPQSLLEESRQRLHVSAVPASLPCREEEFSDIYSFVKSNLLNSTGGCMYVSGVPGTGKTATVQEVIRTLQKEQDNDKLPFFRYVEVNGMKMTNPYQCYVQVFQSLTGQCVAPQQAANLLEKRFTGVSPKSEPIVLLVDELDKLWTRKQTVMYNIFDWPTKPFSKLIVIAIANTMDLPERLMMSRISSRLGLTRRTFQPYTFRELQEIVMSRIQELKVFDPDAVLLVAKKVAAVSGDARRALEICRRAAEVAEDGSVKVSPTKKKKVLVGITHVDSVLSQMFSSPIIAAIRGTSALQKMFLKAILAEFQRTGSEETNLLKSYNQLIALCRFEGLRPPTTSDTSALCVHLASSSILLLDNVQNDLYMKIRFNVSMDDVNYALTGRQL